jgi:hypothetical protein
MFERANKSRRHCEERSDEAIHRFHERKPWIASLALAMTAPSTALRHSRRFASASLKVRRPEAAFAPSPAPLHCAGEEKVIRSRGAGASEFCAVTHATAKDLP